MSDPARRRFTMPDALLLIAATAVGLVPLRTTITFDLHEAAFDSPFSRGFFHFAAVASPLMLSWTAAVAVCGLVRPRPSLRLWGRRPGLVAALVGATRGVVYTALDLLRSWKDGMFDPFIDTIALWYWTNLHGEVAPPIFGAWVALGMAGAWEPDASWPDRAGRWLGSCWLIMYMIAWMARFSG